MKHKNVFEPDLPVSLTVKDLSLAKTLSTFEINNIRSCHPGQHDHISNGRRFFADDELDELVL